MKHKKKSVTPLSYHQFSSLLFGIGLLIGLIGAILSGFGVLASTGVKITAVVLFIIGVFVGIMNVSNKEANSFMLATVLFVLLMQPFLGSLVQAFQISDPAVQKVLGNVLLNLIALFAPAGFVVAIKTLFTAAKDSE